MSDGWQMSAEDAEEYTRALGQIMSGGWRQIALAQRLGVPEAIGMTTEAWVRERIGGYVRLGLDERREAVKALTDPAGEYQLTQRQAAEVLGVGKGTVQRDLEDGPSGPSDVMPPGEDADNDGPDGPLEGWAETSVDVALADLDAESPTVGDVREEIRAAFDEEGLAEDEALRRHMQAMARVRITWLRFMSENPPGVFLDGLDRPGVSSLIGDLDRFANWIAQARAGAVEARRPRRVV